MCKDYRKYRYLILDSEVSKVPWITFYRDCSAMKLLLGHLSNVFEFYT